MLELYHNDMAVCAAKVRMVLAEKTLPWKGHHLDLSAGESRRQDYLRLNPNGVVPTLVDDGQVLIESSVICEYLDEKWPHAPLRPADPLARARMRLWTKQLDEGVHAATGAVTYCTAFRQAHLDKSSEELEAFLARMPSAEQRERVGAAVRLGVEAPAFATAIKRLARLFGDMAGTLSESRWLAGNGYSLADIAYTPYATRLEHLGLEELLNRDRRVADWAARLKERPSYEPGMSQWFNARSVASMASAGEPARRKLAEILAS